MLINREAFVSFDVAAHHFQRKTLLDCWRTQIITQYQHEHLLNNELLIGFPHQKLNVKTLDFLHASQCFTSVVYLTIVKGLYYLIAIIGSKLEC